MTRAARTALAALAVSLVPASAEAGDDAIVRDLLGIGGAIILNGAQQDQPHYAPPRHVYRAPSRTRTPVVDSKVAERRAARAEIQRRLNMLGFDAGRPDGIFGPHTRRAIVRFQISIGHAPNGTISRDEIALLYQRTGGGFDTAAGGNGANDANGTSGFSAFAPPSAGAAPAHGSDQGGAFPQFGSSSPGGSPSGFPTLGAAKNAQGTAPGGFPAVGGSTASTGTAFPALGNSDGGGAQQGEGFPALGGKPAASGSETAFPALGSKAKSEANAGAAFPTLGNANGKKPDAMPGLSPGKAAGATNASPMPALAKPDAVKSGAAMPELASPGTKPTPVMPTLGTPERGSESATAMPPLAAPKPRPALTKKDEGTTLAAEAGHTEYKSVDKLPQVLDIGLGDKLAETRDKLKAAGFETCKDEAGKLSCTAKKVSLTDTMTIWNDETDGAWAIVRSLAFEPPVPAELVLKRFRDAYPTLMSAPEHHILSGRDCASGSFSHRELVSTVTGVAAAADGRQALPQRFVAFAERCPLDMSLTFDGGDRLTRAELAVVDLTAVTRRAAEERARADEAAKKQREQVSSDLKL